MPIDELVRKLRNVAAMHPVVETQRALVELVEREFREDGQEVRLDPRRVRRLALQEGVFKVDIEYALKGNLPRYRQCPVCSTRLKRIETRDLFGKVRKTHVSCPTCGFWTGNRKQVPRRYVFHRH